MMSEIKSGRFTTLKFKEAFGDLRTPAGIDMAVSLGLGAYRSPSSYAIMDVLVENYLSELKEIAAVLVEHNEVEAGGSSYWLTEAQYLYLATEAHTPKAEAVLAHAARCFYSKSSPLETTPSDCPPDLSGAIIANMKAA